MVRSPAEDTGRVGESSASSGVEERGQEEGAESGQRVDREMQMAQLASVARLSLPWLLDFPTVHVASQIDTKIHFSVPAVPACSHNF